MLQYRWGPADVLAAKKYYFFRACRQPFRILHFLLLFYFLLCALGAVVYQGFLLYDGTLPQEWVGGLSPIGLAFMMLYLSEILIRIPGSTYFLSDIQRRTLRKSWRVQGSEHIDIHCQLRADSFEARGPGITVALQWETVREVGRTPEGFLILLHEASKLQSLSVVPGAHGFFWLPRSAFHHDSQVQRFEDSLRRETPLKNID